MPKRTIEIEDSLDERLDNCKEELLQNFKSYLKDNLDIDNFDTYYQKQACDSVHEIVDSGTPIYTGEIEDIYYLYSSKLEEAYRNAGIYTEIPDNYKAVCIYLYLEQETFEFMRERLEKELFVEFTEKVQELEDELTDLEESQDIAETDHNQSKELSKQLIKEKKEEQKNELETFVNDMEVE